MNCKQSVKRTLHKKQLCRSKLLPHLKSRLEDFAQVHLQCKSWVHFSVMRRNSIWIPRSLGRSQPTSGGPFQAGKWRRKRHGLKCISGKFDWPLAWMPSDVSTNASTNKSSGWGMMPVWRGPVLMMLPTQQKISSFISSLPGWPVQTAVQTAGAQRSLILSHTSWMNDGKKHWNAIHEHITKKLTGSMPNKIFEVTCLSGEAVKSRVS